MTVQKNQCQSCDLSPALIPREDSICGLATGLARLLPPSYAPIQLSSNFSKSPMQYSICDGFMLHVTD
ncbi:uncharacterized protein Bfra_004307 [Botrytis fragariae]|uniref:Uncharacterized protein n=1 Tax=Botrytis fragariae TaxID=1964551 RepID=A0A8H6AV62_9HELO|nr:uncharacterized protein Bfra_004307 [Botrytis fragariae]KAF5874301.1 hypothetical protein Bfra_004307 [Botrytis fragariae]